MVYFISDGERIKIGFTTDIRQRLNSLQTANSNKLKLLYRIDDGGHALEKHIHEMCERYRLEGEWFLLSCLEHLMNHPWYKLNMKQAIKNC